jgi:ribosomal 30S subunit maturation factor RimM
MSKDEQKILKELNSRMKEFKAALKDEKKKFDLMENIPGSEVLIRFEIFLPSQNPEEFVDGLFLYMNDKGEIVNAEYYFRDMSDVEVINIPEDDLSVITDLFGDSFTLEVE